MQNYINTGNLTSRNDIINSFINKIDLIICTKENTKKIISIQKELYKNNIIELNCISLFIDLIFNDFWSKYIISIDDLCLDLPNEFILKRDYIINLEVWQTIDIENFLKKLNDFWYNFSDFLEPWNFKKNWDSINIKLKNQKEINISFFWDIIEDIFLIEKTNTSSLKKLTIPKIKNFSKFKKTDKISSNIASLLKNKKIILDNVDIHKNFEDIKDIYYISFDSLKTTKNQKSLDIFDLNISDIIELKNILKTDKKIEIATKNIVTINNFLSFNNLENIKLIPTTLNFLKSYKTPDKIFLADDNLSKIFIKKRIKRKISQDIDLMLQIKPGDFVIHKDHWLWIFRQITTKTTWNITREYIEIDYEWNDKLFVPITEVDRISKYIWLEKPKLNTLWKTAWKKKLEKAWKDIEKIANELLEIYAKRKITPWYSFFIDRKKINDFTSSFEYIHTDDQLKAIEEILQDMNKPYPMERILIWDVWFGKTEVAFHAIYNAFLNKKQSIFISPLVVLAYEHFESSKKRLEKYWVKIEVLTRFESKKKENEIIKKLSTWEIDLIIWTHKLLSDKIKYKDLWLLIIDEEHKFWVEEKEKIKKLSQKIDVLMMSATPIPRSLNMAFSWLKDFSILQTPPANRKWIETFVSNKTDEIIKNACENEFNRWWQVIVIHNRVQNIEQEKKYLQKIMPKAKIIVTHWQLPWDELEQRIIDFKYQKYDILLSSTVIENGINFENANTIIINDSYKFWISQIHQLRWRVWRSDKKWYCYLLFDKQKINEDQAKRLQTIVEYTHLWAWFELAAKDLEIRWRWEILWIKQSWTTSEIWISLYLKMLEEKIEELKNSQYNEKLPKQIKTTIDLNIEAYLSNDFFTSELDKINFYKELEYLDDLDELISLKNDFIKNNQNLKKENENLFLLLETRIKASKYSITKIGRNWVVYEIIFDDNIKIEDLKKFLLLDYNCVFTVVDLKKIKVPCQKFKDDLDFLNFISSLFDTKKQNRVKIKLKK